MTKKSCKKGYSCGKSCISITYICKKEFPIGISVSIDGARNVIINQLSKETDSLKNLEDRIRIQEFESLAIFSQEGNQLALTNGSKSEVELDSDMLMKAKNSIITHNHPMGRSFSPEDLYLLWITEASEIRAVTKRGVNFSMKKKSKKDTLELDSYELFMDKYMEIDKYVIDNMGPWVETGVISVNDANLYHHLFVSSIWADRNNFKYSIENLTPSEDFTINSIKSIIGI